jgi:tRNA (cytidine/uridine-2'-O-)-methyltransferase
MTTDDARARATFRFRRKWAPQGRDSFNWRGYGLRASSVKVVPKDCASSEAPGVARLRARPLGTPLHIVLVEPEIPPNTGNIARLAAATASPLHLVGRLGFRIDEHSVRRAGLDYWHLVDLRPHPTFDAFLEAWGGAPGGGRLHLFSATGTRSYLSARIAPGDALVFGKESVGLPPDLLERFADRVVGIPTLGPVRSLNLANAVSIAVYEALRGLGALDDTFTA